MFSTHSAGVAGFLNNFPGILEIERLSLDFFEIGHGCPISNRSQSPVDMLEHKDNYGQAQVCSKGHQGSTVNRLRVIRGVP